jgi:hypothetical protein
LDESRTSTGPSSSRVSSVASTGLEGSGELDAKDLTGSGDVRYVVPDGKRLTLRPDGQGGVQETWEDISSPSWRWIYAFGDKDRVDVLLKELN